MDIKRSIYNRFKLQINILLKEKYFVFEKNTTRKSFKKNLQIKNKPSRNHSQKKRGALASCHSLSKFYDNSIVLTAGTPVPFNTGFIVRLAAATKP
jgi:hypothetical protein